MKTNLLQRLETTWHTWLPCLATQREGLRHRHRHPLHLFWQRRQYGGQDGQAGGGFAPAVGAPSLQRRGSPCNTTGSNPTGHHDSSVAAHAFPWVPETRCLIKGVTLPSPPPPHPPPHLPHTGFPSGEVGGWGGGAAPSSNLLRGSYGVSERIAVRWAAHSTT